MHINIFFIIQYLLTFVLHVATLVSSETESSNIFCSGDILHYVEMSKIFNDTSYFVHKKLKYKPSIVQQNFKKLLNMTNKNPDKERLTAFVNDNFEDSDAGCTSWIPNDWVEQPKYIDNIYDINFKNWAKEINLIWKQLGRKINEDVLHNSSLYSLLYVPHPFIVPGGKFTEFYYWDSFWIIEGLIISEMFSTAKNMLKNYLFLVEKYGYVPNGGRVYYLGRSQPPMLIPMFDLYWNAMKEVSFLKENIHTLEKEFQFWIRERSIFITKDGIQYRLFHYKVNTTTPRPESYYIDVTNAKLFNESEKLRYYSEIKSAAESGWDFSSRWFIHNKTTSDITDAHTSFLAPVCLNSIMGYNAKLLSKFYLLLGNELKSELYEQYANDINKTVSRVFWHDGEGIWFDYNIKSSKLRTEFYPSSLVPLWAETYGMERENDYIAKSVLNYLYRINISSFPGGIPTSFRDSGQQWDFPNGWAPLQYFIILGLRKLDAVTDKASLLAFELAEKWTSSCYKAYMNSTPHSMYEKYDVTKFGSPGGGGEYVIQKGFGWTNGVVIKFLQLYSHHIRMTHFFDPIPYVVFCSLLATTIVITVAYKCRLYKSKQATKMRKTRHGTNCALEENFV